MSKRWNSPCDLGRRALRAATFAVLLLIGATSACVAQTGLDGAKAAYDKRDFAAAFQLAGPLAEAGNAEAQNLLGLMYENGEGVKLNAETAAAWYRKAAEQGHGEAQLNLGALYENGEGVARNEATAAQWYQRAAEGGNMLAQYSLALMYRQGRGVARDDRQAAKWFAPVAQHGFAVAQINLAFMYLAGEGVPQDAGKAVELFRAAGPLPRPHVLD